MATTASNAAGELSTEEESIEGAKVAVLAELQGSIVAAIFAVEKVKKKKTENILLSYLLDKYLSDSCARQRVPVPPIG